MFCPNNIMKIILLNKKAFILIALIISVFCVQGQYKENIKYSGFFDSYYFSGKNAFSINAGGGLAYYSGDLCGKLSCNNTNPTFNLGLGYKIWPRVRFGIDYKFLSIGATDETSRGYSFTSINHQLGAYGQFYFREDIVRRHQHLFRKPKLVKPYFKLGVGGLMFSPVTLDADNLIVTTLPSIKYTLVIPASLGIAFDITKRWSILTEVAYQYTFTDLLDGYSSANTNVKDMYGSFRIEVQYTPFAPKVKKKRKPFPVSSGSKGESENDNPDSPTESKPKTNPTSPSSPRDGGSAPKPNSFDEQNDNDTDNEEIEEDSNEENQEYDEDFGEEYDDDVYEED